MHRTVSILCATLLAAALTAPACISLAQTQQAQPPPREDNRWGGLSHQPTEAEVQQQENAAGLALPSQQQKAATQDVEQMYQNLMKDTASSGRSASQ